MIINNVIFSPFTNYANHNQYATHMYI